MIKDIEKKFELIIEVVEFVDGDSKYDQHNVNVG